MGLVSLPKELLNVHVRHQNIWGLRKKFQKDKNDYSKVIGREKKNGRVWLAKRKALLERSGISSYMVGAVLRITSIILIGKFSI